MLAGQQVLQPCTGAAGLEHELRGDVIGQVEDLLRFSQAELTRRQPVGVLLRVVADAEDLQLGAIFHLDHQPIAEQHIEAGGVLQLGVVGHHHRRLATEAGDLVVGDDHAVRRSPTCGAGDQPGARDG